MTEDVGPDYELVNKLGKDRDTCVVVDAPEAFFAELTSGLREVVEIVGGPFVAPCRYADRIQHVAGGDPLGAGIFVKEPRYAYQREVRACWNGKRPIEPVILERCGAGRYCSIACTWKHVEDSGVMSGLKVV